MAFTNHVGALTSDNFGNFVIGSAVNASVGSTGNTAVSLPISAGSYIVRRITVNNANATINTANVVVLTSSDGNASNAVSNVTVLSSVTSNLTYQDIPLSTAAATTVYTQSVLYVKINTAVTNGTCDITVYGDIVTL
jgi:hypothetical protein